MKEVMKYTFEYNIRGKLTQRTGCGTTQLNAEADAIDKIMRELNVRHDHIKFVKVIHIESTGEWV